MTDTHAQLPHDLDAEETVLGAMMLSAKACEAATEELQPGDFFRASHGKLFAAMAALHGEGVEVDAVTVSDRLHEQGLLAEVGGKERVHEIAALVPAAGSIRHHARIVVEMATLRNLIRVGNETRRLGIDRPKPVRELVDDAERLIFELGQQRQRSDFVAVGDTLAETFRRLEALGEAGADVIGCASGFRDLDRLTAGFQPGNLIVIAARPSIGKSALALGIAANVAVKRGLPVALFTLEMSRWEVTQRLLSGAAFVDSIRLRTGQLDRGQWTKLFGAHQQLRTAPLLIDDTGGLTVMELRSKARRAKLRFPNLALVVVDYLQLMDSGVKTENRVQEVSKVSRALKVLAGELEVPVLALSQLSRAPEQRHDRRPILSDLRESGAVEQDADVVAFLYRDEYYNPEDAAADGTEGICEVNVAKHRNGPTGVVKLAFVKRYALFDNLAP